MHTQIQSLQELCMVDPFKVTESVELAKGRIDLMNSQDLGSVYPYAVMDHIEELIATKKPY